eukprot:s184_g18.t1
MLWRRCQESRNTIILEANRWSFWNLLPAPKEPAAHSGDSMLKRELGLARNRQGTPNAMVEELNRVLCILPSFCFPCFQTYSIAKDKECVIRVFQRTRGIASAAFNQFAPHLRGTGDGDKFGWPLWLPPEEQDMSMCANSMG